MAEPLLQSAIDSVPTGAWAVGVSGGADSVALLDLLRGRNELRLHVVHLDHETRGQQSTDDAEFVMRLADQWGIAATLGLRRDIEPMLAHRPANASALFRAMRLCLYRTVVKDLGLRGVILAHHADDQAETVMLRLLRGSLSAGLAGMSPRAMVGGLLILRPLLGVPGEMLRQHLRSRGIAWREDSSNASPRYLRNRVRAMLRGDAALSAALLDLSRACAALRQWTRRGAPTLGESFAVAELADLPRILAAESARRWLVARAAPADELGPDVIDRLIEMAADAASAPRQHFPGGLLVRRRAGRISLQERQSLPAR